MSNPFSGSDIPGMNAMGDTLSFVKKLWGGMQVPGMVAPPMSVDELDKKIQDLKTVESWLTVNMNMLRGTIQALEVQRATLAALQSLGESFAHHAQQASAMAEQAAPFSAKTPDNKETSNANWPMHPAAENANANANANAKAKAAHVVPEPDPDEEVDDDKDMPPDENAVKAAPTDELPPVAEPKNATENAAGDANSQFVNPAAWWGLLQEQFKQAVSKAMEGEQVTAVTEESAPVKKAAKKPTVSTSAATTKPGATVKVKPESKTAAGTSKVAAKTKSKTPAKAAVKPVAKTAKTTKPK